MRQISLLLILVIKVVCQYFNVDIKCNIMCIYIYKWYMYTYMFYLFIHFLIYIYIDGSWTTRKRHSSCHLVVVFFPTVNASRPQPMTLGSGLSSIDTLKSSLSKPTQTPHSELLKLGIMKIEILQWILPTRSAKTNLPRNSWTMSTQFFVDWTTSYHILLTCSSMATHPKKHIQCALSGDISPSLRTVSSFHATCTKVKKGEKPWTYQNP